MAATCGHCKTQRVSVDHVKMCSRLQQTVRPEPKITRAKAFEPTLAKHTDDITGTYQTNVGDIYWVKTSHRSSQPYAMKWVNGGGGYWDYVGRGPLHFLTEANRLTAEQAAEFGHKTGRCVFCNLALTHEDSLAVGYGPVCATNNGLPWGEAA